jgi:recombination protein RecT
MADSQDVVSLIRRDFNNPTMVAQFKAALPAHVSVEKFQRVVLTAIQSNYLLMQADRVTLLRACMEAAADGLLPDGREGAIVPFRNGKANRMEAQWQPMVWGLVKLVRNSGELKDLGVEIVRSSDQFERWIDENGPHFKHTPSLDAAGDPVGVYAYARTKDGGVYIEYMPWREIEKFRAMSKAKHGPWNDWLEEMAKVRPIKRLCKRLPMSTDTQAVIDRDNQREMEMAGERIDPVASLNESITQSTATPALENAAGPAVQVQIDPWVAELEAQEARE